MSTDISEEHVTFISRLEELARQDTSTKKVESRAIVLPKFWIV
jgi:hypothetical protein